MAQFTQETRRFPPVEGLTVRGEFDGGALSLDFGLTERLAHAVDDS